ncbi:ArnT family glycosyltransferase [Thiobaca trueperi]|uniref:4-amino-4-deoxy-L-arabinose transferase-like glycosyltransferase n=1 Tax=Thiobaca trueperi TaxID=127458 RepID=A0A4V2V1B8_9GAMM|nr:glycosyltransferase family 39 protein [Thiobaca trueperi]TCT20592.1 4-amino-4-deoxy-L-arabinose transferase-like glycosyltransferase [Thiobaca trueperi]
MNLDSTSARPSFWLLVMQRAITSPWLLILVVALSFFWQLGAVPLYDLDEGAFTEATREMLDSGNFITPHKDGEPRYDKPVLIYWLQAASAETFGFDEFALRLPSALAASLWVLALWFFVRARLDAPTATVAGLTMALCLQVSLIGKAAVADALLNLFIALTFFEIYRYYLDPDPKTNRRFVLRAYLWMGLGFLTKGPVAVFFPVVVSFLFFLSGIRLSRASLARFARWFKAVFAPLGWLIFLLIAGPWYLAVYLDDGAGFFRSFFLEHNAGRFSGTLHGHAGFPGYYLVMLPLVLMPFTGWFLSLVKTWRTAWSDPLDRFLWIWFLTVLVFFSFSGTKLPHYLLYGSVPVFILMARHRDALTNRWLAFAPPLILFALLVALPWMLDAVMQVAQAIAASPSASIRSMLTLKAHELALLNDGRIALDLAYGIAVLAGLAGIVVLLRWSSPPLWQRLILAGMIQSVVVFGFLVPRIFEAMQAPVKEAGLLARQLDLPTVVYRTSMPSFSVYRDAITPHRPPVAGDLVFLRIDKLEQLARDYPELSQDLLYRRGPVALIWMRSVSDSQTPSIE